MDICIDLLNVGNADAIVVWLRDAKQKYDKIVVIDAGNEGDGDSLFLHLETQVFPYCFSKEEPDFIVCSHLDDDHLGGMLDLVEYYPNSKYLFHEPRDVASFERTASIEVISESLRKTANLLTKEKFNPENRLKCFASCAFTYRFRMLAPTRDYYESQVKKFKGHDEYMKKLSARSSIIIERDEMMESLEQLGEKDDPSPFNKTSIIIMVKVNGKKFLFPGDAAQESFQNIDDWREKLSDLYFLKVPHHGSKRNLSEELLNVMRPSYAAISASGTNNHPDRALLSYLDEIGTKHYCTAGHHFDFLRFKTSGFDGYCCDEGFEVEIEI